MSAEQIARVRGLCDGLSGSTEKVSHGEPTFFVDGRVYAMFADNHHGDGHIAVWVPTPPGAQTNIIATAPETYFRPPYVGARGWVGIELTRVNDDALRFHLTVAHDLIAKQRRPAAKQSPARPGRPASRPPSTPTGRRRAR